MCPTVLNPRSVAPLGARLLVLTGDHGLGARRVRAVLPALPEATTVVLDDYAGLTWADLAADRGDRIDMAMQEFIQRRKALPAAALREREDEIADISFRVRGAGPPLVLLPLDLSPCQWEPLIPALSVRHCTITLGGPLFSSVASLEERGCSAIWRSCGGCSTRWRSSRARACSRSAAGPVSSCASWRGGRRAPIA